MLLFKCEHCGDSKEYNQMTIRNFQKDTVSIKDHTVCQPCGEEYKDINRQVQEFADKKRKELEDKFFAVSRETQEDLEEEDLSNE